MTPTIEQPASSHGAAASPSAPRGGRASGRRGAGAPGGGSGGDGSGGGGVPTGTPGHRDTLFDKFTRFVSRLSTRNNFWHRVCSLIWLPYAFRSGIRMKRTGESTFSAILPFRKFNRNWYNAMAGAALLGNSEIAGGMYVFGRTKGGHQVVCKNLEYKFLRPCLGPAEYRVTPRGDLDAMVASGEEFDVTVDMDVYQLLTVFRSKHELARERRRAERRAANARAESAGVADGAAAGEAGAAAGVQAGIGGAGVGGAGVGEGGEAGAGRKDKPKRVGKVSATFHVTPMAHTLAKGRL